MERVIIRRKELNWIEERNSFTPLVDTFRLMRTLVKYIALIIQ